MLPDTVRAILERDLGTLREELLAYEDEADLWKMAPGIPNSAGTLALHLVGNLQHYIGARLGETGYRRDRDAEFARRNVPREELVRMVEETSRMLAPALAAVDEPELGGRFPDEMRGMQMTVGFALVHIVSHFGYHLGQINYHRRLLGRPRQPGLTPG